MAPARRGGECGPAVDLFADPPFLDLAGPIGEIEDETADASGTEDLTEPSREDDEAPRRREFSHGPSLDPHVRANELAEPQPDAEGDGSDGNHDIRLHLSVESHS